MSDQANNNSGGTPPSNNNNSNPPRRNNNRRRHNNNRPRDAAGAGAPNANGPQGQNPQGQASQGQRPKQGPGPGPRPQGNHPNQNQQGQGQKRRPNPPQHNRPKPQHNHPQQGGGGPFNIERIYEKYLNLLDQHIIARRKYHDLFYRADPAQKNKLERNFYNTLNDVREFESKLAPDVQMLFEKRNNGYMPDRTYTSNHAIPIEGDAVPKDLPPAEPHLLQSQIAADYKEDDEESVGTAEDYLKYKNF
jgi:hypothetical protein